jgi:hypothetical protein
VRARLLTAAIAATAVLAGCATVPTQGPIRSGSQAGLAPVAAGVNVQANPPRPNMPPLLLVNAYLEAMSDSSNFDQARQYMTQDAAGDWKPESKLSVYDQSSANEVTMRPDGSVLLRAPLMGTIDNRGSWTPARQGTMVDVVFKLADVDGQKRVSNAPDGAYLGSNQFESRLVARSLYFLTPDRQTLVPDPVFLPVNLPPGQVATQLVQELLKGPTSRFGNGVVSAAPPGTQVNVSVPVELSTATVALSDAAQVLGPNERKQLAAQIVWTLRNISPRVRITVGGAPLIDEQPELSVASLGQFDSASSAPALKELYGLRNGKIQHIVGLDGAQDIAAVPLDVSQLFASYANSLAVNLRGDSGAIVTTVHGDKVVQYALLDATNRSDKPVTIKADGTVLRPSYDYQENLWILDRADSHPRLRVRDRDGKVTEVAADFGTDTPVALRMAPDGVRALLLMKTPAGQQYVETATIQFTDAKQLKLGQFRKLELPLAAISDVAWNQNGILVAGRSTPSSDSQPYQVNTDGSQFHLLPGASSAFEADRIASTPNSDTFPVIKDTKGRLHGQLKDLSWQDDDQTSKPPPITPVYPG